MKFITKIKDTQKLAKSKNVQNWYNCILQSIMLIFLSSILLSGFVLVLFYNVDDTTPIGQIPIIMFVMPFIISIGLSYIFLEKLIILHILVYEKFHKKIFKAWQNFDMWYFRKYRKHSPLTEYLAKIQEKQAKLSKNKRKLLLGLMIAGFILLNVFVRIPMILDSLEEKPLPVIDQESDQVVLPTQENKHEIVVRGVG